MRILLALTVLIVATFCAKEAPCQTWGQAPAHQHQPPHHQPPREPSCGCPKCAAPPPRRLHHQQCGCVTCRSEIHVKIPRDKLPGFRDEEAGPGAPEPSPVAANPGYYVAPPRSGRIEEAGRSMGIRGMAFTLPKLRFELPSIELPHIVKFGNSQRMRLEAADAPFMSGPSPTNFVHGMAARGVSGRAGESGELPSQLRTGESGDDPSRQEESGDVKDQLAEIQQLKDLLSKKQAHLEQRCAEVEQFLQYLRGQAQQMQSPPRHFTPQPQPQPDCGVPRTHYPHTSAANEAYFPRRLMSDPAIAPRTEKTPPERLPTTDPITEPEVETLPAQPQPAKESSNSKTGPIAKDRLAHRLPAADSGSDPRPIPPLP